MLPSAIITNIDALSQLTIKIVSPDTLAQAQSYLSDVRGACKSLKAAVMAIKKPHQDEIKSIDAAAKPLLDKLQTRDNETEHAILAYNRLVKEKIAKLNQRALEKFEDKVEAAEAKAVAQGKPMPLIIPPALASAPAKTVTVDGGGTQTIMKRKAWRIRMAGAEVADPSTVTAQTSQNFGMNIPLEFFVLDTARIGKIVRAGGTVPGIEVYETESISVRS